MYEPTTPIEATETGCRLHLYARPRASRTRVAGRYGTRIKLQVAAPPVDGAANDAIIAFLAQLFGVGKSAVVFVSGESGKRKTIDITGVSAARARQLLELQGDENS